MSDAAVFATVCDDNSDDDFVKPHTSNKRKKVIKPKVTWSEKRCLTRKISAMTTRIEKMVRFKMKLSLSSRRAKKGEELGKASSNANEE